MKIEKIVELLQEDYNEDLIVDLFLAMGDTILYYAKKYTITGNTYEDNVSILNLHLLEVYKKYDPSKGASFKTFFSKACANCLMNEQRDNKNILKEDRNEDISCIITLEDEKLNSKDIEFLVDLETAGLNDTEMLIVKELIFGNAKNVDIAEKLHITKGRVSQIIKGMQPKLSYLVAGY